MKINEIELELKAKGYRYLAGIDEAGRGPLAGPVVAAAVVFPEDVAIDKINDSKKLSPRIREELYEQILKYAHVGIGIASVSEIDQYNILKATLLAMKRSVDDLPLRPDFCLIDGNQGIPDLFIPQNTVVQGDRTCFCIAAASIVAKVTRIV